VSANCITAFASASVNTSSGVSLPPIIGVSSIDERGIDQ
jgi:hypothetical protein